jgi:hypothetical protein
MVTGGCCEGRRRRGVSGWRRGKLGGARGRRRLGEAIARAGAARGGRERACDDQVLAVRAWQSVDDGDGVSASASYRGCLRGSWCRGPCACERRKLGKDGAKRATRCPGGSRAVSGRAHRVRWHAVARYWARAFWPLACEGELGPGTGRVLVLQGGS